MTLQTDQTKIQAHQTVIDRLKNQIKAAIFDLPDNPDIQRLSNHPQSFLMKYGSLRPENWTPMYYDFEYQYDQLVCLVDQVPPEKLLIKLQTVLTEKKFKLGPKVIYLHPEVIKKLQDLL
jgi:hypothetical protein